MDTDAVVGERDGLRAALENVYYAFDRYRNVHSRIESGLFTDADVIEKYDAYVNLIVVADGQARPLVREQIEKS